MKDSDPAPDSEPAVSGKTDKHALGVVLLTVFIDLVGFSIIFPLFPAMLEYYLTAEGHSGILGRLVELLRSWTPAGYDSFLVAVLFGGVLGSIYSLLQFAASPYWGALSDRIGRRRVLLITTTGTLIGYLIWIVSGQFWILVLARVINGFMAGNIAVATAAVADITSGKGRSKGMALIGVAFGVGFIIGPAIGGAASLVDLSTIFPALTAFGFQPFSFAAVCASVLAVANVIWVYRSFKETHPHLGAASEAEPRRGLKAIFRTRNPAVRSAVGVYFIFLFAFSGMEFTLTFLALERLMYEPSQMTGIFLFVGFILVLTQGYFVRKYAARFGEINLVMAGLVATVLGLVILAVAFGNPVFYLGLFFISVGVGLCSPTLTALVSLYSNDRDQGRDLGSFRSAGALARALGPFFAALAFWYFGSAAAYGIGAGVVAAAAIKGIFLPKPFVPAEQ